MIKFTVYRDVFGSCSLDKPKDRYTEGLYIGLPATTTFHENPDGTLYFMGITDGVVRAVCLDYAVGYGMLRVIAGQEGYEKIIHGNNGRIRYIYILNNGLFFTIIGDNLSIIRQQRRRWMVVTLHFYQKMEQE